MWSKSYTDTKSIPSKILGLACLIILSINSYGQGNRAVTSQSPNVVFIISDDLASGSIGAYGNQVCKTPNIDNLAKKGVRFLNTFCQYPVCGPSRAALLSGLYPERMNIMNNGDSRKIDQSLGDNLTMPEHFRKNGYRTYRLSKIYHMRVPGDITAGVDGPDHPDSWDEKYNFKGPEWMTVGIHSHVSNEKLNFDSSAHYNLGFGTAFYVVKGNGSGQEQPDFRATNKAIDIIKNHGERFQEPFFIALGFVRPHVPLVAPATYYNHYPITAIPLPQKVISDRTDIPDIGMPATSESFGIDNSPDKQKKILAAYYASVSFIDQQVGRIVQTLKDNNQYENTIIVFTSDHGYHLGEHDFWQKLSLHEESVKIPLIICGPGIRPGSHYAISEQIDIYPTLSELCMLPSPSNIQGKSMVPVITKARNEIRKCAYSVTTKGALLRTKEWAYIEYHNGESELYDMKTDPKQINNLTEMMEHQKVKKWLKDNLKIKQKSASNH